jgi:hypothetical protein
LICDLGAADHALVVRRKRKTEGVGTAKLTPTQATGGEEPEVILDFLFDRGLLHVEVANVSDLAAYDVSMKFKRSFKGLGGACDMTKLPLFQRLRFLAPRKRIQAFLDQSAAYFARGERVLIEASISYADREGRSYRRQVTHDLSIYKDLAYAVEPGSVASVLPVKAIAKP